MQIVDTTKSPWELIVPNTRGGDVYRKVIVAAQGGDQVSYDVRLELFGEGDRAYTSIRHRHDFEQLRFAVSGRMDLGVAMLDQGQVGYFPANAYYGPQKCDGAVILIAQWGDHFITKADSDRAVAELSRAGQFTDGIYRSAGPDGKPFNKDPLNAIWEQVFQRPYIPQKPRYTQPVVISPDSFGWSRPHGPVRTRRLGVFTENDAAIETLAWTHDGTYHAQPAAGDQRPTLLFTTAGSFTGNGDSFGALTGIWAGPGEPIQLYATAGSELLQVRFPAASSHITLTPDERSLDAPQSIQA
jgi:hypothetical protein